MMAILFLKLNGVTVMLDFLAMYLLCKFDDASCHFFFQNEAKIVHRQSIYRPGHPICCFLHSEAEGPITREI